MDRWSVHRAALMQAFLARSAGRTHVEWLPGSAPDLSRVDQVCGTIPNKVTWRIWPPHELDDLDTLVGSSIRHMGDQSRLLRAAFHATALPL